MISITPLEQYRSYGGSRAAATSREGFVGFVALRIVFKARDVVLPRPQAGVETHFHSQLSPVGAPPFQGTFYGPEQHVAVERLGQCFHCSEILR